MNHATPLELQKTALQFFEAYNERDVSKMLSLFTEDSIVSFIPMGANGSGKVKELGQAIWSMLIESFPNLTNKLIKSRVEDSGNLICELNFTGKQVSDFADIKCNDQEFDTDHIFIFKLDDDGLINELSVTWDHNHLVNQLKRPVYAGNSDPSERRAELIAIASKYVNEGLGGKDFDAIPYHDQVSLRAPINPGGSLKAVVGKEVLRNSWWKPLPDLVDSVHLKDVFINEDLSAVTVEFHCDIKAPQCTLRIIDRFKVNDQGLIISQGEFSLIQVPLMSPSFIVRRRKERLSTFNPTTIFLAV